MVPYQHYNYPPYVISSGRGYFTGGRGNGSGGGGGGPMGARPNGEAENGGMKRGSVGGGKGGVDGTKKGKAKLKKGTGIQNYHNQQHGADSAGSTNNQSFGGSTQQQHQQHQQQRWKNDRGGDSGSSKDGNDTYGKHTGKNNNHHPRGVGKYDNVGWDRMNRGNNRSQNDAPSSTDGEGRIAPSDTYYAESNNPLARVSGGGPLHPKAGGGRKKKGKRRDGDTERRKDSNLALTVEDHKREIFDANSFPALSPSKNDAAGAGGGSSQPKNLVGNDSSANKTVDLGLTTIHRMSGYADALKQTTKSFRSTLIIEQQSLTPTAPVGLSLSDSVMPHATTTVAVVTPPPVEMTMTTTKGLEDTFADMKIVSTSLDGPPQPQEQARVESNTTTIAVGALTGMPTTEVDSKSVTTSLDTTVSESPPMSVSPTDVAPDVRQSKHSEPTPREASHSGTKPSEQDVPPAVMEESGGTTVVEERVVDSSTPSLPPQAWGNKRSWIDVARKQS